MTTVVVTGQKPVNALFAKTILHVVDIVTIIIYCGSAQISKLTRWCSRPCHISKADCLFLHQI